MKVYLEEKDIERKITTYHDGFGTRQGLYVYGKDKIEVLSLSDYTKQVRKEVCEEIGKHMTKKDKKLEKSNYSDSFVSGFHCCYCDVKQILDQIQGETK